MSVSGRDTVSTLFECFGVSPAPEEDLPSAPFCYLADAGGLCAETYVMHADPVHLRPDRERLLLYDARHLDLKREEAESLVDLFNGHFSEDGMVLEAPRPDRWYLRLNRSPRLRTTPLHGAVGRSLDALLPQGQDALDWARRLNEVQMLFFHSEVNQRREQEGRVAVSGIWPWGGGRLSATPISRGPGRVFGEHPLAAGLAAAAGIRAEPLPDDALALLGGESADSGLVLWDRLWSAVLDSDGVVWAEQLRLLDAWLRPLMSGIRRGAIAGADFLPCNGDCYRVGPWDLRRFWRRPIDLGEQTRIRG